MDCSYHIQSDSAPLINPLEIPSQTHLLGFPNINTVVVMLKCNHHKDGWFLS